MGQKHSAKYSLKKSSGNNKQQTAKIEDEIAFNTDSPGRASDDPIGVNLSSSQNDYIRNAANNMAKVWTETAVIESNGRNEKGNDGKENESSTSGEGVAANMPEVDKSSVPDNQINQMQEKPADEEPMPNNEGDVIQNIVVSEQKVIIIAEPQPSEKPTIRQTEYAEEENIVTDEQILSNTSAEECDESIQQFVDKNDIQTREIGLEAKMDLYGENGPNEVKEIGNNELEKVKTEVVEMPNEINKNSMEIPDEQNEVTQQKEEEVANHSMLENEENQNPILEGIADYVANQQNVQSVVNVSEEIKDVEMTESDGKDNFVSKSEDEKYHAEIETEDFENSNISSMPMVNVDAIMDDPKISAGSDNELKEINQNEHQNECQKLANDIDNGEPNSIGKPSQL